MKIDRHNRNGASDRLQARNGTSAKHKPNRLVIHKDTSVSFRLSGGKWVRHVRQIPEKSFLSLPATYRRLITIAECRQGRTLVENSRLIVNRSPEEIFV